MDGLYRWCSSRGNVRSVCARADFHHPQGGPGHAAGCAVPGPGRWKLRAACPSELVVVVAGRLAQIHPQVEAKAVQVIGNAAGKAKLHAPQWCRIKSHPAIEAVFARQAGPAADRRLIKCVLAFARSALSLAHDLAEYLLIAERKDLISEPPTEKCLTSSNSPPSSM